MLPNPDWTRYWQKCRLSENDPPARDNDPGGILVGLDIPLDLRSWPRYHPSASIFIRISRQNQHWQSHRLAMQGMLCAADRAARFHDERHD